jgi:hypothetical protein
MKKRNHSSIPDFDLSDEYIDSDKEESCPVENSEDLSHWATSCCVKMTRMDLSAPLNQRSLFLPLDSRTLLKTMRSVSSRIVPPGTYNHFY